MLCTNFLSGMLISLVKYKKALVRFVLLGVVSICLLGCESTSQKPELDETVEAPFVPIPNPNALLIVEIPEQAKIEFQQVKQAMSKKQWDEAYGLLELMIETYPTLSGPYTNVGVVAYRQGNKDEAEQAFKFAIEKNQYNFDAYNLLGNLYRQQGRFEEAETIYTQALELWPHHFAIVKNLGVLYDLYMGKLEMALSQYELAQKIIGGENRQLKGWIIDTKRRLASKK